MGLFDRFKKRVIEVAEEVDSEALTAVEDSEDQNTDEKTEKETEPEEAS